MTVPSVVSIRRLADARSFEHGEEYLHAGRVARLESAGVGAVRTTVDGTQRYRVSLRMRDAGGLEFTSDCPIGSEGVCCKHCVAAALAWKAGPASTIESDGAGRSELRAYLQAQTPEALVALLLDVAACDDRLRDRLLMAATTEGARATRLGTFRAAIDRTVATRRFVSYSEMWDYAAGIQETTDGLERLLGEGHAADVIELAEYALAAVEGAMQEVDDSSGHMGGILEALQELHLKACRRAKPDQRELAERLFAWELRGDWDTISGAHDTYARAAASTPPRQPSCGTSTPVVPASTPTRSSRGVPSRPSSGPSVERSRSRCCTRGSCARPPST